MLLWLAAKPFWYSVTVGFASRELLPDRQGFLIGFHRVGSLAGVPEQRPRLKRPAARTFWYSVTVGLASASFCQIATAS